jgi:hypothetical protein
MSPAFLAWETIEHQEISRSWTRASLYGFSRSWGGPGNYMSGAHREGRCLGQSWAFYSPRST